MCTFNCAQYLERSIKSILAQDYDDFELLVVNDASTDNTLEVLSQFNDPRLRVITNETNQNTMMSRKIAFENSKGDYILWCDADDYFTRTDMLTILSKYDYEMVTYGFTATDVAWGYGATLSMCKSTLVMNSLIRRLCRQCCLVWCRMFRRDLLERVYSQIKIEDAFMNEDTVLVKTAINICNSYAHDPHIFYYYDTTSGYTKSKERLESYGGRWGNIQPDTINFID